MEEIMKRAQADLKQTQTAIYETALPLYKKYFPNVDSATLADKHKVTAAVLDKLAEQHPDDTTVVGYAKDVVGEATNFVRSHNLVTIPETPLDVIAMPEFKRGVAIAYCDSPGPLDKTGKTFFAVAPTPKDWSKERKESFFREYNNYMIRDLTVHEAMPGHYLQLAHANEFRAPTLVRAIFQSGTFVEGWAVYCEQMMAEISYGGPEVKMQQLKMRLRAICNAILDQSIHAGKMSQQEGEAVAKWKRARLTSAQLSTYFVGVTEHLDLRDKAKAKAGTSFDLKKYNDQVISYGSPPVKYVRELMGSRWNALSSTRWHCTSLQRQIFDIVFGEPDPPWYQLLTRRFLPSLRFRGAAADDFFVAANRTSSSRLNVQRRLVPTSRNSISYQPSIRST